MKTLIKGSIYLTTDDELGYMYGGSLLKDRPVIFLSFSSITGYAKVRRIFSIKNKHIEKNQIVNNPNIKNPSYIEEKISIAIPRCLRKKIAGPCGEDLTTLKRMETCKKK